jgi:hypothetical protein
MLNGKTHSTASYLTQRTLLGPEIQTAKQQIYRTAPTKHCNHFQSSSSWLNQQQCFHYGKGSRHLVVDLRANSAGHVLPNLSQLQLYLKPLVVTVGTLTIKIPEAAPLQEWPALIGKLSLKNFRNLEKINVQVIRANTTQDNPELEFAQYQARLLASLVLSARYLPKLKQFNLEFPAAPANQLLFLSLSQAVSRFARYSHPDFRFQASLNLLGGRSYLRSLEIATQIMVIPHSTVSTRFSLDLDCNFIILNTRTSLLRTTIERLTELTELKVNLKSATSLPYWSFNTVQPDGPRILTFTPYHQLQRLTVNFRDYPLAANQLTDFCRQIKKLPVLASLNLSFKLTPEMDQIILAGFAASLGYLNSLTELDLSIAENYQARPINPLERNALLYGKVNVAKMEELEREEVREEWSSGLELVGNSLSRLTRLQHLTLDLSDSPLSVNNQLVQNLTQAIVNLPNLASLSIKLANCPKLHDEGLAKLMRCCELGELRLNSLEIDLTGCSQISLKGLAELAQAVENYSRKTLLPEHPWFKFVFKHDSQLI